MIDERDFEASKFWKRVESVIAQDYKRTPRNVVLTSLTAYFLVMVADHVEGIDLQVREHIRRLLSNAEYNPSRSCNEEVKDIFHSLGIDISSAVSRAEIDIQFSLIHVVLQLRKQIDPDRDQMLYFFDAKFRELAKQTSGVVPPLTHFAAVLANTLADPDSPLIDTFCTTGELFATMGGEQWKRSNLDSRARTYHPELEIALRMRLILRDLSDKLILRDSVSPSLSFSASNAVVLCDFGFGGAQQKHIENGMEHFSMKGSMLDPYLMSELIKEYSHSTVVLIAPGTARNSARPDAKDFRRQLIGSGRLSAVIDFPIFSTRFTPRSAWILNSSRQNSGGSVLLINLRKLGIPKTLHDIGLHAEFAGRIYRKALHRKVLSRWATPNQSSETDRIRDIFAREFGDDYSDVDGLCVSISRERLLPNPKLIADEFLINTSPERSLLSIDYAPILPLLSPGASSQSNAIYVIGNNGEGKSLMLRQLSATFCLKRRRVIGLSFGASDRFPRSREELKDFRGFTYEGARGSADAVNSRKTGKRLAKHLISMYRDDLRRRLLESLLRRVGFDPKVFIMGDAETQPLAGDLSNSIVQLTSEIEDSEVLLRSIVSEEMQPAFIRGRRGAIAKFSELSSGEQQVLSMVIRLVANANTGALILIDEPEISLHVSWQKLLPALIERVLEQFECDVVVATHSPLVISSATGNRDHCFVTRRQRLEPVHRADQHSVESVLLAGFETYTPNNRLIHERCAAIVAAAMEVANSGTSDKNSFAELREELDRMKRILKSQREVSEGTKESDRLISKAREAIDQISGWRDVPMTQVEEN